VLVLHEALSHYGEYPAFTPSRRENPIQAHDQLNEITAYVQGGEFMILQEFGFLKDSTRIQDSARI
jgi:hypothetical protein